MGVVVASFLTKNEGCWSAWYIDAIAFRLSALHSTWQRSDPGNSATRSWARAPAIGHGSPGHGRCPLESSHHLRAGAIRACGVRDFFGAGHEMRTSVPCRFDQTVPALAIHLWLAPVSAVGVLIYRDSRASGASARGSGVASPAWLWLVMGRLEGACWRWAEPMCSGRCPSTSG